MSKRKARFSNELENEASQSSKSLCPEDADIAFYGNKLRLRNKKHKGIPREFYQDGLGEILEYLDGEKDLNQLQMDEDAPEEITKAEYDLFYAKKKNNLNSQKNSKERTMDKSFEEESDKEESDEDESDEDEGESDEDDFDENSDFDENEKSDNDEILDNNELECDKKPKNSKSLSNEPKKWVSKRVLSKMQGLSLDKIETKKQDLSYLDQDSEAEDVNIVKEESNELHEDMYGRLIDHQGNVIQQEQKREFKVEDISVVNALTTKIRGLLNRLSVKTIPFVVKQIEEIYKTHSNNLFARCMSECIDQLIVKNTIIASQKLCTETVMLITVLHSHIGQEVTGNLLHSLVCTFDYNFKLLKQDQSTGKQLENLMLVFCLFYSQNLISDELIYDILFMFVDLFTPKCIEMLLFILKLVGYQLRKDNPSSMKDFILRSQQKASQFDKDKVEEKKVLFLLESLTHIRNNNSLKMDLSDIQGITPIDRSSIKNDLKALYKDLNVETFTGKYKEILRTNRWYVQSGELLEQSIKRKNELRTERAIPTFNEKLCKKMQLTTPFRKLIFNTLITCEDYVDCSQKLIQNGKKKHFEVIGVCVHVGLTEKIFNPFYVHLFRYLAHTDRNYKRGVLFVLRDKIINFEQLAPIQQKNLAKMLSDLLKLQVVPLVILKIINFKDMTEQYKSFLLSTFNALFTTMNNQQLSELFGKLDKKEPFTISLKLFINMFMDSVAKTRMKQIKEGCLESKSIF